jgi:hypothetical protein
MCIRTYMIRTSCPFSRLRVISQDHELYLISFDEPRANNEDYE